MKEKEYESFGTIRLKNDLYPVIHFLLGEPEWRTCCDLPVAGCKCFPPPFYEFEYVTEPITCKYCLDYFEMLSEAMSQRKGAN